jgi:hypothetical protein
MADRVHLERSEELLRKAYETWEPYPIWVTDLEGNRVPWGRFKDAKEER